MITAPRAREATATYEIGRPVSSSQLNVSLGQLPSHWVVKKLKFVASIRMSNVDKHSVEGEKSVRLCNYVDVYRNRKIVGELPFMEATASEEQARRFALQRDDVLITKDSEAPDDIGIPSVVAEDLPGVVCGYHLALLRPRADSLNGRFLAWLLRAPQSIARCFVEANGVTRFALGGQAIADWNVPLPPLKEQIQIADSLDIEIEKIDKLIAANERLLALIEEKRVSRIRGAVLRGLKGDVPMRESAVSWLGAIPRHWSVERNKVLFKERNTRSSSGEEELMTVSHLTGVTRRSEKDVNMFEAETQEGYKICEQGDVVVNTMWAFMGALGVARERGIVSPSYNVYSFASARLVPEYFDLFCRMPEFVGEMTRYSKGIWKSRLRLYPDEFLNIRAPLPPVHEQSQIVSSLRSEFRTFGALSAVALEGVERLRDLRNSLISEFMTGKGLPG